MEAILPYLANWGPTGILAFMIILLLTGKIQSTKSYNEKVSILLAQVGAERAAHVRQIDLLCKAHADQLALSQARGDDWKESSQQFSSTLPVVVDQVEKLTVLAETTVSVLNGIREVSRSHDPSGG